ncbi:cytochrome c oxidase subunit II [Mesorhizobium sp. WSM4935]|uniref:cytochrome c oxidase subunit II n=1 Tax=Mesorhizobium sp. WSM4935 TaxID=3038547 RepID=UPI00241501DA|nr:cytochrome c oxidase subunit II [Mesorhizobium sp. WSM4935]MDG4878762.1 cytochrome c oxidase subunit II [Mesorhizobium sp. WSM4935]
MDFWQAHEMQNFGAGDHSRHPPTLWRIDAAKQKNATDQAEGEECPEVKSGLAENPHVASETHGSASSASDRPNNTERNWRVPNVPLSPFPKVSEGGAAALPGLVGAAACILVSGCTDTQSVLDPHGRQADALAVLFWTFTAVLGVVWLVTMTGLLLALVHRRGSRGEPAEAHPAVKPAMKAAFAAMLASSTIILSGLTVLSFGGQKAVFRSGAGAALTISVIGHQWWWQVRYEGNDGFETANEIRIPVGSPVDIKLATADVIHSFWIPSLAGKLDLIPGTSNELRIEADKPGTYRGQCAEFCGQQHAHMAIFVVAMEPNQFERWRANQAAPAKPMAHLPRQSVLASARSSPSAALSESSQ